MILSYAITSFLLFNNPGNPSSFRSVVKIEIAWTFIGAVCDLFQTGMIWLILDDLRTPTYYKDNFTSYPVLDVVRPSCKQIN